MLSLFSALSLTPLSVSLLQRTGMGANDIYGRTGRPVGGGGDDLDDFSDDETPMTEPIYNGR